MKEKATPKFPAAYEMDYYYVCLIHYCIKKLKNP